LTKLASVPLVLKAGAVAALVAGASAVALPSTHAPQRAQQTIAAVAHEPAARVQVSRAQEGTAPTRPVPIVPMALQVTPEPAAAAHPNTPPDGIPSAPASEAPAAAVAQDARPLGARVLKPAAPSLGREGAASSASEADATHLQEARGSTLAAEGAVLAAALRALRAGEPAEAERLLDDHQRTYGTHALLAQERERMRAELSQNLR
jgi:hypothetical protein